MTNEERLTALADKFGADTGPSADWSMPLLSIAKEVYEEFTRPGGENGYLRFGDDVVTASELVNWVYMRWASSPEVTVEWFDTLDAPGAMLRTFLRNAARDIIHQNVEGNRATVPVSVSPTGFTGSGQDEGEPSDDDGAFDWLTNSTKYASSYGRPEETYIENETLVALEAIVLRILDGIKNEKYRTLATLYYIDGLELEEAADEFGVTERYAQKAVERARGAVGKDNAGALIAWRRAMYPDSGRQPAEVGFMPSAFEGIL